MEDVEALFQELKEDEWRQEARDTAHREMKCAQVQNPEIIKLAGLVRAKTWRMTRKMR